jgi:hypothetical protein
MNGMISGDVWCRIVERKKAMSARMRMVNGKPEV